MKYKLLIALLFFIAIITAQNKKEQEIKDYFWGSNDAFKNANEIPEKWKNESAVIIYKNINYSYNKFGKKVTYKTSFRKRIKLLDKNAVEEFSKFSFRKKFKSNRGDYSYWQKKGKVFFAIKIIKEDGKEIEIDVDKEAIKEEDDYKIAISNLEVNDIIDYYYYNYEPFKSHDEYTFEAEERTLSDVYPIMDFKLYLESENDFFINFKSLNGAPQLKKVPSQKRNLRKYELLASDIPKNNFPIWFYPLAEVPSLKFQVYFARSGKFENRTIAFLSEEEKIIKSNVSKEDVLALYNGRFRPYGHLGDVIKYFKTQNFKTDEEKVIAAYYYMRHYYLTRFVEAFIVSDAKIMEPFMLYGATPVFIKNKKQFIKHFTAFLKDYKIDYEIVIGTKRYNGNIKDLLIEENVEVLVKIKTKNPLYAQFFGPHTNINQISPLLHGTDIYLLTTNERHKIKGVKKGVLPNSDYKKNVSNKEINLELNTEFSGFSVDTHNNLTGYCKISDQSDRLLFHDYVYEDYEKYGTKKLIDLIRKKKRKAKVEKEFNAVTSKIKKNQKKELEKQVKNEFKLNNIKDYKHTLINTGRYGLDAKFEYDESFTFKDQYIKKAGANYIIEIGRFIGGQIEIEDEKRQRNVGIYMTYPRTFNYHIKLKIPNGYTVSGIDKLIKNVANNTGAFISNAKLENGILDITTSKQYKHNYEPKENWKLMLLFLDEANQFKNEKILLKKIL